MLLHIKQPHIRKKSAAHRLKKERLHLIDQAKRSITLHTIGSGSDWLVRYPAFLTDRTIYRRESEPMSWPTAQSYCRELTIYLVLCALGYDTATNLAHAVSAAAADSHGLERVIREAQTYLDKR